MTGEKDDSTKIVDFGTASHKRVHQLKETKVKSLRQRFSAARRAAEPPGKAADNLKKLFRNPKKDPQK